MTPEIEAYFDTLPDTDRDVALYLYNLLNKHLTTSTHKIWHRQPVWFIDDNPIVGFSKQKMGMNLMFWSGQSFDEVDLLPSGKFKAAQIKYTSLNQINIEDISRWCAKGESIQWDYKNIVKRKGVLLKLDI
jgi:hypothetical protein